MGGNVRDAHKGSDHAYSVSSRDERDTREEARVADTSDEDPRRGTKDDRYGQRDSELYCPYCGERGCAEGDNFCIHCGAELRGTFE